MIAGIDPLPGTLEFLDWLSACWQVVVLSDTFDMVVAEFPHYPVTRSYDQLRRAGTQAAGSDSPF